MKRIKPALIAYCGILVAAEIILNRFLSFNAWNLKIGFAFLPVALAGMIFGPLAGGIVGAMGDLLGAVLFPTGAYFPGFTATALLSGLMYGWMLHRDRRLWRIFAASAFHQLLMGLAVNTAWIAILYHHPYFVTMGTRLLQCGVLLLVEVVVIQLALPLVGRLEKSIYR